MTQDDLVLEIKKQMNNAHNSHCPRPGLKRGHAHVISSIAEDYIAAYIFDKVASKGYEVWIDPQLTFKNLRNASGKRKLLYRPDIALFDPTKSEIVGIFDIKIDLGYKRASFIPQIVATNIKISKMYNDIANWTAHKNGTSIKIKHGITCDYIVVSEGNSSGSLHKLQTSINSSKSSRVFTLTKDIRNIPISSYKSTILYGTNPAPALSSNYFGHFSLLDSYLNTL